VHRRLGVVASGPGTVVHPRHFEHGREQVAPAFLADRVEGGGGGAVVF